MIELTVTGRGHRPGWLLCEATQAGRLVFKVSAPALVADNITRGLDNNYTAKSLIPLFNSDLQWLLSRQGEKK